MREFDKSLKLIAVLRGDNGCPWDKMQTIKTLKEDFLEESGELIKAIESGDTENLCEEIGDVIWTLLLMCRIAEEEGLFNIEDVLKRVNKKMRRRHPHVFGGIKVNSAEEAKKIFLSVKAEEHKMDRISEQ